MKRISLIIVASLFLAPTAKAGVLLEPFLGYNLFVQEATTGDGAAPIPSGQSIKIDAKGIGFGLRLGYGFKPVFAAFEYSTATLASSLKEAPAGIPFNPSDVTATTMGVVVGADLMVVRPYVGYIFDDQSKDSNSTMHGNGYKLGVGFGFFPKVKINLEYHIRTFTKEKDDSGTETAYEQSGVISSVKATGFTIGVSVPFEF